MAEPTIGLGAEDVGLQIDVVSANTSLAQPLTRSSSTKPACGYPMQAAASLKGLFRGQSQLTVGDCRITPTLLDKYSPAECFPVEDRDELILDYHGF